MTTAKKVKSLEKNYVHTLFGEYDTNGTHTHTPHTFFVERAKP